MMSDVSFNNAADAYPPMPWGICPMDGKKEREKEREIDSLSMERRRGSIYKLVTKFEEGIETGVWLGRSLIR